MSEEWIYRCILLAEFAVIFVCLVIAISQPVACGTPRARLRREPMINKLDKS